MEIFVNLGNMSNVSAIRWVMLFQDDRVWLEQDEVAFEYRHIVRQSMFDTVDELVADTRRITGIQKISVLHHPDKNKNGEYNHGEFHKEVAFSRRYGGD